MTEKEYRAHPAISQSFLKQVLKNDFTQPNGTNVGLMVDNMLYNGSLDSFFIGDKIPKAYLKAFQKAPQNDFDAILKEVRLEEYYNNWKDEKHLEKIKDLYPLYLMSNGLIIVTKEEHDLAMESIAIIQSDPIWLNKGISGEYQKPLFGKVYTKYGEVEIKGLLDELHQDWNWIVKDLKVTDCKLSDWQKLVAKPLMYPFQAAFYTELVKQNYGVTDVEFQWLVYSTVDKKMACFIASSYDLGIGEFGNSYVKGWREALEIYAEGRHKGDYFIDFVRGNGVIKTTIYGSDNSAKWD